MSVAVRVATRAWRAVWIGVMWLLITLLTVLPAQAGVMDAAAMRQAFPAPLQVGEREARLPVWPLFKQEATATVLVGYAFESIDLAPVPGFSGTPINLLVLLDAQGRFLDVRVLSQHEPVFLDGLGPEPLHRFVAQYAGLSLKQNIKVGSANGGGGDAAARAAGANVTIDGVAKATASVRIVNQSLLGAALKVAREKLGYAAGRDPALIARVRTDGAPVADWAGLQRAGLAGTLRVTTAEADRAFAGTVVEGVADADLVGAPGAPLVDATVLWLSAPPVGRHLLTPRGWAHLQTRLDEGDHALLVLNRGRWRYSGEGFVRGAVPDRLALRQAGLPIELRDLDLDDVLNLPAEWRDAEAKVFRIIGPAGLDPALPLDLLMRVTRSKGQLYPERVSHDFALRYQLLDALVQAPLSDQKTWQAIWVDRAVDLTVLVVALVLLAAVLARPRWLNWLVADAARLARLRTAYLAFTLGFIGWHAQGQLSIVNLTALVQALRDGRGLGFFLYDPMTVLLWVFVAGTLVLWGRAAFCGWLCPFGALQELVAQLTARLGLRRRTLPRTLDARLKRIKYGVLALVLLTACVSGPWTDRIVELEPFKTAITLVFVRGWPFVLWALLVLGLGAWVYKGYCRYLCPLGAGLALLGRLRRIDWIARRTECGQPCQTCRHRCEYQAIDTTGRIDYDECFQCLDCVAIHASPQRCAPLIARARPGKVFPIHAASAQDRV